MKKLCFLLLLLQCSNLFSQSYYPKIASDVVLTSSEKYDPMVAKSRILAQLEARNFQGNFEAFAINTGEIGLKNLCYGNAYESWPELEKLIQKTSQEFLKSMNETIPVTAQILRSTEINAYATAGGYMFFNIGLIAEVNNYQELALVIAHELGHNMDNHMLQGSIDRHNAERNMEIASVFLSGLSYKVAQVAMINNLLGKSREDERQADVFAYNAMNKSGYSVLQGAEIYQLFSKIEKQSEIKQGSGPLIQLYGSTHPDPESRYSLLITNADNNVKASEPAAFKQLMMLAKYEKLNTLIGEGNYRHAIETAWRYMMLHPNNDTIEQFMFDAIRKINILASEEELNTPVLKYNSSVGNQIDLTQNNDETVEYVGNLLLIDPIKFKSPFSFSISFRELYNEMKKRLTQHSSLESDFLLALDKNDVSDEFLAEYINKNGVHSSFAKLYLERDDYENKPRSVCYFSPYNVNLSIYKADYFIQLRSINWYQVNKVFTDAGFNSTIRRRDLLEDYTLYERQMCTRMESINNMLTQNTTLNINFMFFDPLLGEYLLRKNIKEHFNVSAFNDPTLVTTELTYFDISRNKVYFVRKNGIYNLGDYNWLSKAVKKRYKEIKLD